MLSTQTAVRVRSDQPRRIVTPSSPGLFLGLILPIRSAAGITTTAALVGSVGAARVTKLRCDESRFGVSFPVALDAENDAFRDLRRAPHRAPRPDAMTLLDVRIAMMELKLFSRITVGAKLVSEELSTSLGDVAPLVGTLDERVGVRHRLSPPGPVAEWLGSGLQSRARQFESGRDLSQACLDCRHPPSDVLNGGVDVEIARGLDRLVPEEHLNLVES